MTEKTTKDKKERTLSLKPGLVSSTKAKGSRSPRASTVVVESRRGRLGKPLQLQMYLSQKKKMRA